MSCPIVLTHANVVNALTSLSAASYHVSKTRKAVLIVTSANAKAKIKTYCTNIAKAAKLTASLPKLTVEKRKAARSQIKSLRREARKLLGEVGLTGFKVLSPTKVRRVVATKTIMAGTYGLQFEESVNDKKARTSKAAGARKLDNKEISALSGTIGKYGLSLPRAKSAKTSRRYFKDEQGNTVGYLRKSSNGTYIASVRNSGAVRSADLNKILKDMDSKLKHLLGSRTKAPRSAPASKRPKPIGGFNPAAKPMSA